MATSNPTDLENYQGLKHTILSPAEKSRLLAKMVKARESGRKRAFRRARDEVVKVHLRLGLSLVRRYGRGIMPQDDLLQVAAEGLCRACESFDVARNVAFSTYASFWIRHRIEREIGDNGRTIRLPIHRQEMARRLFGITTRFETLQGRAPTDKELAKLAKVSVARLHKLAIDGGTLAPIASLDATLSGHDGSEGTLLDILPTPGDSPEDTLHDSEEVTQVRHLLASLPERERTIIEARFGFGAKGEEKTLHEIGDVFGVTRERSRQIQEQALERLRRIAKFQFHNFGRPVMAKRAEAGV